MIRKATFTSEKVESLKRGNLQLLTILYHGEVLNRNSGRKAFPQCGIRLIDSYMATDQRYRAFL
jgi:hypothetical protein